MEYSSSNYAYLALQWSVRQASDKIYGNFFHLVMVVRPWFDPKSNSGFWYDIEHHRLPAPQYNDPKNEINFIIQYEKYNNYRIRKIAAGHI